MIVWCDKNNMRPKFSIVNQALISELLCMVNQNSINVLNLRPKYTMGPMLQNGSEASQNRLGLGPSIQNRASSQVWHAFTIKQAHACHLP